MRGVLYKYGTPTPQDVLPTLADGGATYASTAEAKRITINRVAESPLICTRIFTEKRGTCASISRQ